MAGTSRASALITRTVTSKVLALAAASTTPNGAALGTENRCAGKAPGPLSGGSDSPSRSPSPRTVTANSMGSPTCTTLRLACTAMAKPRPTALTKPGGRPACGSGRTVNRRRSPSA